MPDNIVNIFLSHKIEDKSMATRLKELLERYTGGRLKVYISEEIVKGTDWLDWIREKLGSSHLLLLLFTGHNKDWNWPVYEAGFFTGLTRTEKRRVICVDCLGSQQEGNQKEQLKPLQNLQHVIASDAEDIERFVEDLYLETALTGVVPCLGPALKNISLRSTFVTEIRTLLCRQPFKITPYGHRITLTVKPEDLDKDLIPAESPVELSSTAQASLFRKADPSLKWKDLTNEVSTTDKRWLEELWGQIRRTKYKDLPSPPLYLYVSPSKKAYYTSLIEKQDRQDDSLAFTILFSEEPRWGKETFTTAVGSFEQLMIEMSSLIEDTPQQEAIRILAYTPAIGFLARTEKEWERLGKAMDSKKDLLSFTCLKPCALQDWHNRFIGKSTARECGHVDEKLARLATEVSETLIEKTHMRRTNRKEYAQLPHYYLVSNDTWAIIVVPFFLPNLNVPLSEDKSDAMPNVDMFGIKTNNREVVNMVKMMHDNYIAE